MWHKFLRYVVYTLVLLLFLGICVLTFFNIQRNLREAGNISELKPENGKIIETSDAAIYIEDSGPKFAETVVLIHGTGTWGQIWKDTTSFLVDSGYRVITIDIPPFGYSEKLQGSGSFTREKQARRIVEVLDKIEIEKIILVGHSVGARPALEVSLRAPQRVKRLVLVDPALGLPAEANEIVFQQNKPSFLLKSFFGTKPLRNAVISTYGTNPLFLRRLLESFVANKSAITSERIETVQQPMVIEGTTEAYGDWLKNLSVDQDNSLGSNFENLKTIRVPVSIIWGEADTITPLWQADSLKQLIPGSELEIIPGVGHIPYLENTQEFNLLLLRFIK